MVRMFAVFLIAVLLLAVQVTPFLIAQPGILILGGHYYIGHGESLMEDMSFYFTQVTIEEGASVDGQIFLFSSTLDLAGHVTEDIHAFESDLVLRETARVDGVIDEKDLIHWTVLLPSMAQLP